MDLICRYWAVSPALHLLSHALPTFVSANISSDKKPYNYPPSSRLVRTVHTGRALRADLLRPSISIVNTLEASKSQPLDGHTRFTPSKAMAPRIEFGPHGRVRHLPGPPHHDLHI